MGHYVYFKLCHAKLLQSCSTLCDCMDYSPPGTSVHVIFQIRRLEGAAISFSKGIGSIPLMIDL